MMRLEWIATRGAADLALTAAGGLAAEVGLGTSVLLSLFLDARADADEELPDASAGALFARRGWVGDAIALGNRAAADDRIGSRLWLLSRAKQTDETARLAEDYAAEALAWMLTDGLAVGIDVAAAWIAPGALGLVVQISPPAGDAARFEFALRTP